MCHLGNHVFHSSIIAQSFNIGVTIFFIISGYLYSNKVITDEKKWIANRLIRLYMPLLATNIIMIYLYKLNYKLIYNFLNLQGISSIIKFADIKTLIHPWFLTVIMICYFILIPVKRIEKNSDIFGKFRFLFLFFCLSVLLLFCKINLISIFTFFVGYYLGKINIKEEFLKKYYVFIIAFIILSGLRIVCKEFFDDTLLYNDILVPVISICLSLCFILLVKALDTLYKGFHNFCQSKPVYFIDMISVYIYVQHSFFINNFSIFKVKMNLGLQLFIFLIIVIAVSYVSYLIFEKLGDVLRKKYVNP